MVLPEREAAGAHALHHQTQHHKGVLPGASQAPALCPVGDTGPRAWGHLEDGPGPCCNRACLVMAVEECT